MELRDWLESIGLDQFADVFEEEGIDLDVIADYSEEEFKELGLKSGHCKRLFKAIESLSDSISTSLTESSISWPDNLLPDNLPIWLAHPWIAYCEETHPRVKLHWLVDLSELVVRWTVAVALAEVLHANGQTLPAKVAQAIVEHIERPTLGRWLAILRALCDNSPKQPAVTTGLFEWASETLQPLFGNGDIQTSLLELRNQVAHGGGMASSIAQTLIEQHQPRLIVLLRGIEAYLTNTLLVANGQSLMGKEPKRLEASLPTADNLSSSYLMRGDHLLSIEPLAHFGTIKHIEPDGHVRSVDDQQVAQLYTRGAKDRLSYTPLGRDESHSDRLDEADVQAFRELFQLDALKAAPTLKADGFAWDDFLREARASAEDLIGRRSELKAAKDVVKSIDPYDESRHRLAWINAGPGVGKSMLMARLAADYGGTDHRGLYLHRFKGGDSRNNRRSFLRLLQAALCSWTRLAEVTEPLTEVGMEGQALEDDVKARLAAMQLLEPVNPKAPKPAFWIFIDGLDEAMGADPNLPALIKSLALPGTLWLIASRPDQGLAQTFDAAHCLHVFEPSMPPMHRDDIRAMLLEGLGNGRYELLKLDEDTEAGVQNQFVEHVVTKARGLPLYVHLLIEDINNQHFDVKSGDRLPDGLTAYYDDLVDRLGVSDAKADLTAIVALLSQATEPLDESGLALLLAGSLRRYERFKPRVTAAIRVGQSLLRRAPSPDTADAWTLYHQSFREYVNEAVALQGSIEDARERLFDMALEWADHTAEELKPIRCHLFRWGTEYALWWHGAAGLKAAQTQLTDFYYLQARAKALPSYECTDLAHEYEEVYAQLPAGATKDTFDIWRAFFSEQVHILRRGDEYWGAEKILLQLAVEHADDSPITQVAEAWLEADQCDWVWLRNSQRPEYLARSGCIRVFEGHDLFLTGASLLDSNRALTLHYDGSMVIWELSSGIQLKTLKGHTGIIRGVFPLSEDRIVSWSDDKSLKIWSTHSGECLSSFENHPNSIYGVVALDQDRVLSWYGDHPLQSKEDPDYTLKIWQLSSGKLIANLEGHTNWVIGVHVLNESRVITWSLDGTIRFWDVNIGQALTVFGDYKPGGLFGHCRIGAIVLDDGHVISWSGNFDSNDFVLRLWDANSGEAASVFEGHSKSIEGALMIGEGRFLSWSIDSTLRLWNLITGDMEAVFNGHTEKVNGVVVLDDGHFLSWSDDSTIRLWDINASAATAVLEGHFDKINGVKLLNGGMILSWSKDRTLRLWDISTASMVSTFQGHWARGGPEYLSTIDDKTFLSWASDGLRLWNMEARATDTGSKPQLSFPTSILGSEFFLTKSSFSDKTRSVWNARTGTLQTILGREDGQGISRELVLNNGNLLTWSANSLSIWDCHTLQVLHNLKGHTGAVSGAVQLIDGRILSYSVDKTFRIWNHESGALIKVVTDVPSWALGVQELTSDRLISWSRDNTITVWSLKTGKSTATLAGHISKILSVKLVGKNKLLSWSKDGDLRLWNTSTGNSLSILSGHNTEVRGVLQLQDEKFVFWSNDKTLRVWDAESSKCNTIFKGHNQPISGAIVLSESCLLSWSTNNECLIWSLKSGELIEKINFGESPIKTVVKLATDKFLILARRKIGIFRLDGKLWTEHNDELFDIRFPPPLTDAPTFRDIGGGALCAWTEHQTYGLTVHKRDASHWCCWQGNSPGSAVLITEDMQPTFVSVFGALALQCYKGKECIDPSKDWYPSH